MESPRGEVVVEPTSGEPTSGAPTSGAPTSGDTGEDTEPAETSMEAPAKKCLCFGYACVEHNAQNQEVSWYAVDVEYVLGEGDVCEVTQLVKDLLYYACVNSVIHPDWADWDGVPKYTCQVVDG
ncbi:MAG: hypothetical protein R3B09_35255 [Nannocystaceae bacterium]